MAGGIKPRKVEVEPLGLYDFRRTPTKMLVRRLDLERFMGPHRFAQKVDLHPRSLTIPTKQHAGVPAKPVVKAGSQISAGALLADIPEGALASKIFSPRSGRVSSADAGAIRVEVR